MSKSFRQLSAESTQLTDLYDGRKKIETSEVVNKELTIDDFDIVNFDGTEFCALTFKELAGFVYNGGMVLTKMIKRWCEEYGGISEAREAYSKTDEKVKIELKNTKSRNSRDLVVVDVK